VNVDWSASTHRGRSRRRAPPCHSRSGALCAEVVAAGSVREALDTLDSFDPDVMVSDIGMPGEDGYTLIKNVRQREESLVARCPRWRLQLMLARKTATKRCCRIPGICRQTHRTGAPGFTGCPTRGTRIVCSRTVARLSAK
jgi:CheY-like chemotaxis protein